MKKMVVIGFLFALLGINFGFSEEKNFKLGIDVLAGGRFDNLRMCVATPAGVQGGPIADVMVTAFYAPNRFFSYGLKLPIFRPILFAAAFKMLQFEPEVAWNVFLPINSKLDFLLTTGAGLSLHWGPDYKSAAEGPGRTESFWAAGPLFSQLVGFRVKPRPGATTLIGSRFFYSPLFARDRAPGTVIGGALELRFEWGKH